MSDIKITEVAPPEKPEPTIHMTAGNFYRHRESGDIVFVGSMSGDGSRLQLKDGVPNREESVVVSLGGIDEESWDCHRGYILNGLFDGEENYEEVDVEITVKRRG